MFNERVKFSESYLTLSGLDLTKIDETKQQDIARSVLRIMIFELLDENGDLGSIGDYNEKINEVKFFSNMDDLLGYVDRVAAKKTSVWGKYKEKLSAMNCMAETCMIAGQDGSEHIALYFPSHSKFRSRKRHLKNVVHELDHTAREILGILPGGKYDVDSSEKWIVMSTIFLFGEVALDKFLTDNPNLDLATGVLVASRFGSYAMALLEYIKYRRKPEEILANETANRVIK